MIQFVNAKLNLGLHITARRPDGYHDLETIFYPVGMHNGTPGNPEPFCDILEISVGKTTGDTVSFKGREIGCPLQDNLVVRAIKEFRRASGIETYVSITLDKHLPDGAGLGGGSADASFTLTLLNSLCDNPLDKDGLLASALRLGADCPFFIINEPCHATGVGEVLTRIEPVLQGMWAVIVKPDIHISTREAFAGVIPCKGRGDLRQAAAQPVSEWKYLIENDFEKSLFPHHPELQAIKEGLYEVGALYASMSGSGSSIYGIFADRNAAGKAMNNNRFNNCYRTICRL